MKRRTLVKMIPLTLVAPTLAASGQLIAQGGTAEKTTPPPPTSGTRTNLAAAKPDGLPDYARRMRSSDMLGLGPDGKPDPNYKGDTSVLQDFDPSKPPHQMTLTREEQDILDGKKGEV